MTQPGFKGEARTFEPSAGDETALAHARRKKAGWFDAPNGYLAGTNGIDIGAGHNPVVPGCRAWDLGNGDGDATLMAGEFNESFDWVYSSHLLEHLENPGLALQSWWKLVKSGGYLVVAVPEEDSYEKGFWPSLSNSDHKTSWSGHKDYSWGPSARNILDLLSNLSYHKLHKVAIERDNPSYAQIEAVVQKDPMQPVWVNTIIGGILCPCGADRLAFVGVNLKKALVLECLKCGQVVHYEITNLQSTVNKNYNALLEKLRTQQEP